jgi:hypothetical protein
MTDMRCMDNNTHTALTLLESLTRDREDATTPGVKAALTKRINSLTGESATPSGSDLPQLDYSPDNLATLVQMRNACTPLTSPGVKAALTRHAREMADGLGLPDPFPRSTVTVAEKPSKAALKRLEKSRKDASTAGVKAALTRRISAMQAELDR